MKTLNSGKLKIVDVRNPQQLAQKALELFGNAAQKAVSEKGVFHLAISGGKTPRLFYQLLGTESQSLGLPWDKTELFWVDERCVSPDSSDSNYKPAAPGDCPRD